MNTDALMALANRWREESRLLRGRGASIQAGILESTADELEATLREWLFEPLSLDAAALESGLHRSTLERKITSGRIENAGRKGAPRILRKDLPLKGGTDVQLTVDGEPDIAEMALRARS